MLNSSGTMIRKLSCKSADSLREQFNEAHSAQYESAPERVGVPEKLNFLPLRIGGACPALEVNSAKKSDVGIVAGRFYRHIRRVERCIQWPVSVFCNGYVPLPQGGAVFNSLGFSPCPWSAFLGQGSAWSQSSADARVVSCFEIPMPRLLCRGTLFQKKNVSGVFRIAKIYSNDIGRSANLKLERRFRFWLFPVFSACHALHYGRMQFHA